MAVGKTAVGRRLAARLGWRFVDLDRAVEAAAGMKVREIFQQRGEARFRELEKQKLGEILRQEGQVVATGGGAVLDPENLSLLREKSLLVCLTARPETILQRAGGGKQRPLIDVADRDGRVRELLALREASYTQAHAAIATDDASVDEVVEKIMKVVQS
ncbi:MAG TPA: shikimate kinase [Candidatus Binatia bacterium]